jgi:hypothetical protein
MKEARLRRGRSTAAATSHFRRAARPGGAEWRYEVAEQHFDPALLASRSDDLVVGPVAGVQVGEGTTSDTLEPAIVVYFRVGAPDGPKIGFGLTLELAEGLERELARWIEHARERHFEQPST